MNELKKLYTGFDTRLTRLPYWVGWVGIIFANIVLMLIIGSQVGGGIIAVMQIDPLVDLATLSAEEVAERIAATNSANLTVLLTTLITAYPSISLMVKRGNDRNLNPNIVYLYWGISLLSLLGTVLGFSTTTIKIGDNLFPDLNNIGEILLLVQFGFSIYLFVTLGFMRGTKGDNKYGPDPLANKDTIEEAQLK